MDVCHASSMLFFNSGALGTSLSAAWCLVYQSNLVLKWADWHVTSWSLEFFRALLCLLQNWNFYVRIGRFRDFNNKLIKNSQAVYHVAHNMVDGSGLLLKDALLNNRCSMGHFHQWSWLAFNLFCKSALCAQEWILDYQEIKIFLFPLPPRLSQAPAVLLAVSITLFP